jgi:hypothetical protein
MSLDVYLEGPPKTVECECSTCWNIHERIEREEYYERNITHNLNRMADEACIYKYLWRPEELGVTQAKQLIGPLTEGLERLKSDPEKYKKFNASNGWGLYEHLVAFVESYLEACREYPEARVHVSR